MRFDLTDLRLFLNVQEAGSITGGGAATHMTLSSASERILGMERELGVPLLLRIRRGVHLTPAGRTLAHHARLILHQMDQMQGELSDYGVGVKGHVRLLCNTSALSEHLPEILSSFLAGHPGISVDLEERRSDEIADAVRGDVCDIGMVSDSVDLQGLEVLPFRADPLTLVTSRGHDIARRTEVSLADVVDYPFVGLAEGSALDAHVSSHARRLGKRLSYRVRLLNFESVCRVVGQSTGIGIVPMAVANRYARLFKLERIALADAWAARNLVICVRHLDDLPLHARQFVQHLLAGRRLASQASSTNPSMFSQALVN